MVSDIDRKILTELERDAFRPRTIIASELKITESNIDKMIDALVAKGIIRKFTIEINYGLPEIGLSTHAISLVKLKDLAEETIVIEKLKKMDEAVEVYSAFDPYDLCIRWLSHSPSQAARLVDRIIDHVQTSRTHVLGEERKRASGIPLLPSSRDVLGRSHRRLQIVLVALLISAVAAAIGGAVLYQMPEIRLEPLPQMLGLR
jgi:DNA-binding Lrp family transcriptional regulator